MLFYDLAWASSESDQALTLERWSRQDVPVALGMETEFDSFSRDYPRVRAFIDARYAIVERSSFGGNKRVIVFARTSAVPTRTDPATNLPCFR
jgi:hypothetical protein